MRRIWVLVTALACACSGSSAAHDRPSTTTVPAFEAAQPVGLAAADGTVWTVEAGNAAVSTRAPSGGAPVSVHVGDTPLRAAYDGHWLWVSVFGAGRVVAVDPATHRVVREIKLSGQPEGIAATNGSVWVVRQQARRLTQLTSTGAVVRSWQVGKEPRLVAADESAVFVANFGGGTVTRVDRRSHKVRTSGKICIGPQGLAASNSALWVTCTTEGKVLALDPQTLQVRSHVEVLDEPDAIQLDGDHLFVVKTKGPTVLEMTADADHPTIERTVALGHAAQLFDQANVDFAIADGKWWVSSPSENKVYVYTP